MQKVRVTQDLSDHTPERGLNVVFQHGDGGSCENKLAWRLKLIDAASEGNPRFIWDFYYCEF